ncbi:MCE family protein [Actinomadura atramentaria]|uniref:MCE family protein n=1 Tax=Actinomadura atramentaria TaxID=1990 RepID=UPI001F0AE2F5|nr:MCE family protein [Actinomadura atramentaria]
MRNSATILRAGIGVLVIAIVAAVLVVLLREPKQRHLTAYFTSTVGLYKGADVRILGISVGSVTAVKPTGDAVRVDLKYDAKYKVPANAQAVIVNQTLVSDRYVQLTPVYKGGSVLADNTVLPVTRTAVPVEVDEISGSLSDLSKALGPDGANQNGSLSRLLQVGANNLDGQGDDIRQTISDTSKMLSTFSADRGDIAKTVENLRIITDAMKASDAQIKEFGSRLNGVSGQLAGEKEELTAALNTLGPTLRNVQKFVKDNRDDLSTSVRQLAQITGVLVKEKDSLAEFLTDAPLAINNLARAYDPISGTIHTRDNFKQFDNLADWICSLAYSVGTEPKQCMDFVTPYNGIGKALADFSLDLSWITALTTHYDPVPIPPDAYGPNAKKKTNATAKQTGTPRDLSAFLPGGGQ